ncbi:hypothetical protein QEV83_09070 [Methylocapsa sp. D3K7]|uniref:hypothetical protein n=1 Tax=Methylocapsa sp. D3K7 TaxID=3041435 RepID=UPI00244F0194|nr:hypothetical protein [Methylocapsa sp. D3K7]WGJ16362.1 hypothetical protein QEV83_09070 [Methylocapsa sp. D3K7]
MAKPSINLAEELLRLAEMTIFELRGELAAAAPDGAADAAISRSLGARDQLKAPGEAARRPLLIDSPQARALNRRNDDK